MRQTDASSTLTVYHDSQFWVGTFERVEDGKLSVCRVVFGAEPSARKSWRPFANNGTGYASRAPSRSKPLRRNLPPTPSAASARPHAR